MMVLYSGITCPFSHRCRFVLYEKGMDFEIKDVDIFNKPEDLSVMNPYNQVPVLVERDLILFESNIINEYIDERFPHPQLMPGDPVMRGRGRLVRALTAEAVAQRGARERFAGVWESVDGDRDVLVNGADDDDAGHGTPS